MLFVGIDVASKKHDAAITTFDGEVITTFTEIILIKNASI